MDHHVRQGRESAQGQPEQHECAEQADGAACREAAMMLGMDTVVRTDALVGYEGPYDWPMMRA